MDLLKDISYTLNSRTKLPIRSICVTNDYDGQMSWCVGDMLTTNGRPTSIVSWIEKSSPNEYRIWKTCRFEHRMILAAEVTIPDHVLKVVDYYSDEQQWLTDAFQPIIDDAEGCASVFVGNGLRLALLEEDVSEEDDDEELLWICHGWFDFDGNEVKADQVMIPYDQRPKKESKMATEA